MRIAISVSRARFVVASLALLVAGLVASGPPRAHRGAAPASAVAVRAGAVRSAQGSARAVSRDLPLWFGARGQAPVRIAGRLLGAHRGMTVRLAIDVPDPGIWLGREVEVASDGSFDFGPMRAGSYLLGAFGSELMSRVASVDTTAGSGDRTELFVTPCHPVHGAFWITSDRDSKDPIPAVGVSVELSGWVLGTTDASGSYDVCVPEPRDEARLRVAGYADPPSGYRIDRFHHRLLWPQHLSVGIVLLPDGSPASNVGVQPIWRSGDADDACTGASVVMTTDASGRFAYNGASRVCGFRVLRGTAMHDERYDLMRWDAPQIIPLPAAGGGRRLFD
jgi:hypothetical protein